jgi:hypothetical protein
LLDLERFRLDGAALVVTCVKCEVDTRVEAATATHAQPSPTTPAPVHRSTERSQLPPRVSLVSTGASNVVALRTSATDAVQKAALSAEHPLLVPEGVCPKCLAARANEPSCAQCGLDFSAAGPGTFDPPPWLTERWRALLLDWANEALHGQVRTEASRRGALADVGRLYRLRLAWFKDDPWAEAGREEILRMASAAVALMPNKVDGLPARDSSTRRGLTGLAVVVCLAGMALVLRLLLQAVQ